MGKDKEALRKLPKSLTHDDLIRVIEETARIAAKEAVDAVEEKRQVSLLPRLTGSRRRG